MVLVYNFTDKYELKYISIYLYLFWTTDMMNSHIQVRKWWIIPYVVWEKSAFGKKFKLDPPLKS